MIVKIFDNRGSKLAEFDNPEKAIEYIREEMQYQEKLKER